MTAPTRLCCEQPATASADRRSAQRSAALDASLDVPVGRVTGVAVAVASRTEVNIGLLPGSTSPTAAVVSRAAAASASGATGIAGMVL